MTGFAIRRLTRALWRFLLAVVLLTGAVELALFWASWQGGAAPRHVFGEVVEWFASEAPESVAGESGGGVVAWWRATARASLESGKVLGLSILLTLGLGPPLGILAARFRRLPLLELLVSPLFIAAVWPGFWIACLAIWWRVEKAGQSGFANEASGFGLWWHAFLIAAITTPPAIAWQIRSIAWAIREASRAGHVGGALSRGQSGGRLFYRHVFSGALDPVIRSLDRVLPILVGGQLVVEWVFRYPGLGSLVIDSARDGHYAGLLAGGIVMALVVVVGRLAGELIYGAADRRGRDRIVSVTA